LPRTMRQTLQPGAHFTMETSDEPFQKPRPLSDRLRDFRAAIDNFMREQNIPSAAAIAVLEDVALNLKMAHAFTRPVESTRPRMYSGNIPEPRTAFRDLAKKIAGAA
jgi:hypothetical protein